MLRRPISICVLAALTIASAQAATLSDVEGAVSVNRGSGFKPVMNGAALGPGDRVRTEAGSASIVYENGCTARVGPNQLLVVLSTPPACTGGGLKDGPVAYAGPPDGSFIAGGLVIAGGAGLAVALANSSNNPASP
ncbi:MAG: hypothetical protein ACLPPF_13505 [Rhodomicrobium sp.]